MKYVPPSSLKDLIQSAAELKDKYAKNNPERNQLIKIVHAVHDFIGVIYESDPSNEKELYDICLGVWMFARKVIAMEYSGDDSEYKRSVLLLFSWGSKLAKVINQSLNITDTNKPDDRFILIHIEKYYNFAFTTRYAHLSNVNYKSPYQPDEIDLVWLQQKCIEAMDSVMHSMNKEIVKIMNAVPTEEADKEDLKKLPETYVNEKKKHTKKLCVLVGHNKVNAERLFLSQLAAAVADVAGTNSSQHYDDTTLSSAQTIYRGIRLYILYIISDEYYLKLNSSNSTLYDETTQLLKAKKPSELATDVRLNYLIALQNYIGQPDVICKIAEYGKKTFGDQNLLSNINLKMHVVSNDLQKIISQLEQKQAPSGWPVTRAFSWLGATAISSISFGVGSAFGRVANETQTASMAKVQMSGGVNKLSTLYMGNENGSGFGYMAADFLLGSILSRTFGKGAEAVCMLAGAAVGASIGFPIDLLQKAVRGSGRYILSSNKSKEPELITNCDMELIQTLLNLPEAVFNEDKKKMLMRSSKNIKSSLVDTLQQPAPPNDQHQTEFKM